MSLQKISFIREAYILIDAACSFGLTLAYASLQHSVNNCGSLIGMCYVTNGFLLDKGD